mgnify:CR=1 FL=1
MLLFFGGNLFANSQNFSLGDVLKPMGAGGLGAPPVGSIQFNASWSGHPITFAAYAFWSGANNGCTDFLMTTVQNSTAFNGFTPNANTTYFFNGTGLYTMASNTTAPTINANAVTAFEVLYRNADGSMSGNAGGADKCPCYQVSHNPGESFYTISSGFASNVEYQAETNKQCHL